MNKCKVLKLCIGFVFLGMLVACETADMKNINYKVDTIKLSIFGQSEKPQEYESKNKEVINEIIELINSISMKDNEVGKISEVDIPKTISYILEIKGNKVEEYTFVSDYLIYNDYVYRIHDSNSLISSIKNKLSL